MTAMTGVIADIFAQVRILGVFMLLASKDLNSFSILRCVVVQQ